MPKPEESPKQVSRARGEKPARRKDAKSNEFGVFAETIIEFGRLIKDSPGLGFDELRILFSDDSKKGEGKSHDST
ncbi:MAG TPA: hypothetical protein VNA13_00140 [Xanthomonadales bacterium]|nr:hypothetical protein [Xanthomonadales bacterium]